jgi:hypothetical protein
VQALVDDGVLQIHGHLHLGVDLDKEVLKRNNLEDVSDDQAEVADDRAEVVEAAEVAEAETANQDLLLLIIKDALQI